MMQQNKRTNVVLDEKLVNNCFEITGLATKRELIQYALMQIVKLNKQKEILKLRGNVNWEGNLARSRKSRFD